MLNFFLKIVYSHLHKFINMTIATIFLKCSPLPLFPFLLPSCLPPPLCSTHIVPTLPTSNPRCYLVSLCLNILLHLPIKHIHTNKEESYYTDFDAFGFSHSMSHENVSKLTMWLLVILINSYKSSHSFDIFPLDFHLSTMH